MLAIKGIFDGKKVKLLEPVTVKEPQEVIITFLGTAEDTVVYQEIYSLAESGGSFDFLNEPEEDIYTDVDLKVRYAHD